MEQPACPQLHEISMVLPASLQYWLQYEESLTVQLQAGWAHFFFWSGMANLLLVARSKSEPSGIKLAEQY